MHILLTEDDKSIAMGLEYSLRQEGYTVTVAETFAQADAQIANNRFDLVLLDLSLPDGSGYDLCRRIKSEASETAVLFLTACDDEVNVVMGLDMGADDYITKPFRVRELLSRIRSVLRRCRQAPLNTYRNGNIQVDLKQAKVSKNGQEIILTALEYRLLLTLIHNEGQVLSRSQLLEGIWDVAGDFVNDNTLTVYIKRLREKLEDDREHPQFIRTVRGLGYQILPEMEKQE